MEEHIKLTKFRESWVRENDSFLAQHEAERRHREAHKKIGDLTVAEFREVFSDLFNSNKPKGEDK